MLWVPQKGVLRTAKYQGTATAHASSSSTKGTPVELVASTPFDAYWIDVTASGYGGNNVSSQACVDILVGGATEAVLIPNLLAGFCGGGTALVGCGVKSWSFPVYIPAGTRIACQIAGDRLNTACGVWIQIYGGTGYPPFRVGSRVTTYGITTVPAGTDVAAGYSGSEGSWVQIAASTTADHFAISPSFHPTDGDTSFSTIQRIKMDIGIGGAGVEKVVEGGEDYFFKIDTVETCEGPRNPMPCFVDIPAGTRLSARLSYGGGSDTGEPDCALHCVG